MNDATVSVIVNLKSVKSFRNCLVFEHDSETVNNEKGFELGKYQDFILELDHPNLFDNVELLAKFLPKINPHKGKAKTTWHQNWLEPTGELCLLVVPKLILNYKHSSIF